MKVGTLTLHSQLNYGGVLQAFALQTRLRMCGYEVKIIDRWMDVSNVSLLTPLRAGSLRQRLRFAGRMFSCFGVLQRLLRSRRTMSFLADRITLTDCHFYDWREVDDRKLKLDCIIVGSDQVWNGTTPSTVPPYLLDGAPGGFKAIAYAPSFGMSHLPSGLEDMFRKGLGRFAHLSARETSGVEILRALGYAATKVVDPVLLLSREEWVDALSLYQPPVNRTKLFCYLMSEDLLASIVTLDRWAEGNGREVDVVVDSFALQPFFRCGVIRKILTYLSIVRRGRVHVHLDAGPLEFVKMLKDARDVITDSFHAMAFSSIFDCNVRVIKPTSPWRLAMFSRIEEFSDYTGGNHICSSLEEGLRMIVGEPKICYNMDKMKVDADASLRWLKESIVE